MTHTATNIAILDDHPIVLTGIKSLFNKDKNINIVGSARNTEQLFALLEQKNAEALLLDLNLDGVDQFNLIDELQQLFPELKIIAYTAYDYPDLVKRVLAKGIKGYLLKTVSKSEIIDAVHAVLKDEHYLSKGVLQHYNTEKAFNQDNDCFEKKLKLTKRERDVIIQIVRGLTNKRIAEELFISRYTVETHRKNILKKLALGSSAELIQFGVKAGLV